MTDASSPISSLMTSEECAELLRLSLRRFRNLARSEGFPAAIALTPRVRRWRRDLVEAWLAELQADGERRIASAMGRPDPKSFRVPLAQRSRG